MGLCSYFWHEITIDYLYFIAGSLEYVLYELFSDVLESPEFARKSALQSSDPSALSVDVTAGEDRLHPYGRWFISGKKMCVLCVFYFNPLMFTAAKNSLTILMQSCRQKQN